MGLRDVWDRAEMEGRELTWRNLPGRALDEIEKRGKASESELIFLESCLSSLEVRAVAAVRLVGSLGEEKLAPLEVVRPILQKAIGDVRPNVRLVAIEAYWQMADTKSLPILEAMAVEEQSPTILETLAHVIRIFRSGRL